MCDEVSLRIFPETGIGFLWDEVVKKKDCDEVVVFVPALKRLCHISMVPWTSSGQLRPTDWIRWRGVVQRDYGDAIDVGAVDRLRSDRAMEEEAVQSEWRGQTIIRSVILFPTESDQRSFVSPDCGWSPAVGRVWCRGLDMRRGEYCVATIARDYSQKESAFIAMDLTYPVTDSSDEDKKILYRIESEICVAMAEEHWDVNDARQKSSKIEEPPQIAQLLPTRRPAGIELPNPVPQWSTRHSPYERKRMLIIRNAIEATKDHLLLVYKKSTDGGFVGFAPAIGSVHIRKAAYSEQTLMVGRMIKASVEYDTKEMAFSVDSIAGFSDRPFIHFSVQPHSSGDRLRLHCPDLEMSTTRCLLDNWRGTSWGIATHPVLGRILVPDKIAKVAGYYHKCRVTLEHFEGMERFTLGGIGLIVVSLDGHWEDEFIPPLEGLAHKLLALPGQPAEWSQEWDEDEERRRNKSTRTNSLEDWRSSANDLIYFGEDVPSTSTAVEPSNAYQTEKSLSTSSVTSSFPCTLRSDTVTSVFKQMFKHDDPSSLLEGDDEIDQLKKLNQISYQVNNEWDQHSSIRQADSSSYGLRPDDLLNGGCTTPVNGRKQHSLSSPSNDRSNCREDRSYRGDPGDGWNKTPSNDTDYPCFIPQDDLMIGDSSQSRPEEYKTGSANNEWNKDDGSTTDSPFPFRCYEEDFRNQEPQPWLRRPSHDIGSRWNDANREADLTNRVAVRPNTRWNEPSDRPDSRLIRNDSRGYDSNRPDDRPNNGSSHSVRGSFDGWRDDSCRINDCRFSRKGESIRVDGGYLQQESRIDSRSTRDDRRNSPVSRRQQDSRNERSFHRDETRTDSHRDPSTIMTNSSSSVSHSSRNNQSNATTASSPANENKIRETYELRRMNRMLKHLWMPLDVQKHVRIKNSDLFDTLEEMVEDMDEHQLKDKSRQTASRATGSSRWAAKTLRKEHKEVSKILKQLWQFEKVKEATHTNAFLRESVEVWMEEYLEDQKEERSQRYQAYVKENERKRKEREEKQLQMTSTNHFII